MRRFNRGYALLFLAIFIVAILGVRWTHQQVEGRYQTRMDTISHYTLDDWLTVLRLDEMLGDTAVTPRPNPVSTPTD